MSGRATVDAVVVGSGPNGLAAANVIAEHGRSVVVFEAEETIGGGTRSAELTLPGFVHDVCSAVHPLAAGSPFFRTRRLDRFGLEWIHPAVPLAHPLDGGRAALLESSVEATASRLGADGEAYARLMRPFVDDWDRLMPELLAPLHVPRRPLALVRFAWQAIRSARSLAARFREEPGRALLAGIAAHSMLPLEQAPSAAVALLLGVAAHAVGWPFPAGGSQRIADALVGALRSHGGEVSVGRRIECLDELPASRAVLCDLVPRGLLRVAGDRLPAGYRRRLGRYRHGPGVFKMDWALAGPIPWQAPDCALAGTVHVGGTFEEVAAAESAVARGEHPERPFVLVAQQSLFDPRRAPAGKHAAWGYCHVPSGSTFDMADRIEGQIERFAPGFRSRVLARSAWPPAMVERHNANYVGGDIAGGVQDLRQLFARPAARLVPYATPAAGLYLCSSATPPGPGVHGLCGLFAAKAALGRSLRER